MFYGQSLVPYLTVEQAAQILRMNPYTLYRNMHEVPHIMVGTEYRIPCEFLMLKPPIIKGTKALPRTFAFWQEPLPFDVIPQRRWRNNNRLAKHNPFGEAL